MSTSYNNLTIRGRDGRRVPVTDCTIEPLNLLIPGSAPILVPKRTAWRPPRNSSSINQNIIINNKHNSGNSSTAAAASSSEAATVDYDAQSNDEDDAPPVAKRRSRTSSSGTRRAKEKGKEKGRKDGHVKDKAREAKHRRRAESLLKQAERAREEAEKDRVRLARRLERQEAYVAELKAKYESRATGDDRKNKRAPATKPQKKRVCIVESDTSGDDINTTTNTNTATSDSEGSATTDDSARVREMLKNMKIRAAGTDGATFTASEDAQLLVLKKNNESWKTIMEAMHRGKSELRERFKELQASGATIPGEDLDVEDKGAGDALPTDAAAAAEGGATTDTDKTGDETTDAEKTGDESNADDVGDGGFLNGLMGALKDAAEEQAADMPDKSNGKKEKNKQHQEQKQKKRDKKNQSQNKGNNSSTNQGKQHRSGTQSPRGGDSGFDASASEAAAADDDDNAGTRAYIGLYARRLLDDARAGRVRLPEPDDQFDDNDCVLLALADSRRRENRWLDIQSDFANFTGRLVPEEVLRWKLGEGERPEGC